MQPAAVIFDMDGTLTDTEAVWDVVRRGLAEDAGLAWPDGATQAMMGMSTAEWSTFLVEEVGLPMTPPEAARATIEKMAQHHREGITLLPGAVEAVRRMAEKYPIAIVSSSPRVLIDAGVESMDIGDVLTATVSTEEVERGKPEPDGYLRAAELLGVEPSKCVAVEDATNGILSAVAAGMRVVAVPPHFHPPADDVLEQTTVIETLNDLTHELIAELPGWTPSA